MTATTTTTKQHQILAVEPTRQAAADKQLAEIVKTFSKEALFVGNSRRLELFNKGPENEVEYSALEAKDSVNNKVQAVVPDNLNYMAGIFGAWVDLLFQKEQTNQQAKADVIVDGAVIFTDAPATFLLGMETKLNKLRDVFLAIPTLATGIDWQPAPDLGVHVYKGPQETDMKSQKTQEQKLLKQSSDKHPDTLVTVDTNRNIGKYTNQKFSGMMSVVHKAALIARLDKMMMAVKDARQRANNTEASTSRCAEDMFQYLYREFFNLDEMKAATNG